MSKVIGIVGGVGPYAGIDLKRKIFDNTVTFGKEQNHLEVYLLSRSQDIVDRTQFLESSINKNPAEGIFRTIQKLVKIGAEVIGIPCNTAHAPIIFNQILSFIQASGTQCQLLHMIELTYNYLQKVQQAHSSLNTVGLLCTKGTYDSNIYPDIFMKDNLFTIITPEKKQQCTIHDTIYEEIKAVGYPTQKAKNTLKKEAKNLIAQGAQAIIMGCTEIPLAFIGEQALQKTLLVDPTDILARALIQKAASNKLKPKKSPLKSQPPPLPLRPETTF